MVTLTPAYGRDYKSKAAAKEDFDAEKDFILNDMSSPWNGKPVNKQQLQAEGVKTVKLRYAKLRKFAIVEVG